MASILYNISREVEAMRHAWKSLGKRQSDPGWACTLLATINYHEWQMEDEMDMARIMLKRTILTPPQSWRTKKRKFIRRRCIICGVSVIWKTVQRDMKPKCVKSWMAWRRNVCIGDRTACFVNDERRKREPLTRQLDPHRQTWWKCVWTKAQAKLQRKTKRRYR
jgi:hypothetical protein